jgi:hypothetical protein
MPVHRNTLLVIGIICLALAITGGMMYPMTTMNVFERIAYVLTVSVGISTVLFILYRRGFGEEL